MILRRVIFWVGAVSLLLAPYIFSEQTQIQPNTYRAFLLDFDRVNFFSLGECALTMDAPGTTTTVAAYGKSKTVHHTGGCILEPRTEATANSKQWIELTDLEARIEATVNSKQWTE